MGSPERIGCTPLTIRKAWINVDLGQSKKLSKIKIQVMGTSTNRTDSLSGSLDGETYFSICKISPSMINDLDWVECVK